MESRNIRNYLILGYSVRYLLDIQEGWPINGENYALKGIEDLEQLCSEVGLHVTQRLIGEHYADIRSGWAKRVAEAEDKEAVRVTAQEVQDLRHLGLILQATLMAEAEGIYTYVTKDKRFSIPKLLAGMDSLMAPGVFADLPEIAKLDFGEAGRCIAFEAPTAAAFHLMRGTEDVLKWFYCQLVKRERKALMWGPMVTHLRSRRNPPPAILLNNLDSLRVNFRNPTQHPDKVYDIEEVQDLLVLSIDAVNRMVRHIKPPSIESKETASAPLIETP